MRIHEKSPEYLRRYAFTAAVFLLFLYFVLWQLNFYLAESIKASYYAVAVPVLVAGTLYFRRLQDGPEYKLLVFYWLWFVFTRLIHNNLAFTYDFPVAVDLSLMLPFFALGLTLDRKARERFLNWLSATVGGFYFLLGLLCLAAFILRRTYVNPITGGNLAMVKEAGFTRIVILDTNVDSTAYWFMMAFWLMVYQFFACKHKLWRVPIVLAAIVHYAVMAITYTRSVKVALAAALALLVLLLLGRALKTRSRGLRATILLVCTLAAMPLFYKSFDLFTASLGKLSEVALNETVETVPNADGTEEVTVEESVSISKEDYTDPRGWNGDLNRLSSGRIEIYKSALYAIRKDPKILLTGTLVKDRMTLAWEYLKTVMSNWEQPHYHNFLIHVLILTGAPGLLLVLAFCALLAYKTVRLFFSKEPGATLAVKTLTLPVTAALLYGMFEACFFTDTGIRPLYLYLMSGLLLGCYYDCYPRQEKKSKC